MLKIIDNINTCKNNQFKMDITIYSCKNSRKNAKSETYRKTTFFGDRLKNNYNELDYNDIMHFLNNSKYKNNYRLVIYINTYNSSLQCNINLHNFYSKLYYTPEQILQVVKSYMLFNNSI